MDDQKHLVEIASFEKKRDADFAQAVFAENDIESLLRGEGDIDGLSSVFKLLVDPVDKERAEKALLAINDPNVAAFDSEPMPNLNPERNKNMTSVFAILSFTLIGFVAGIVLSDKIKSLQPGMDYKKEFDWNNDGRADSWHYYIDGKIEQQTYDRNYDGKIDEWLTYRDGYHAGSSEKDCDFNGTPDFFVYYDNGEIVKDEINVDDDGVSDITDNYEYGIITKSEVMAPGGIRPRALIEYDNTLRIREYLDADGDGTFDTLVRYDRYGCFKSAEKMK